MLSTTATMYTIFGISLLFILHIQTIDTATSLNISSRSDNAVVPTTDGNTNQRIRCGDKLTFYTSNGKFGTEKYTIVNPSTDSGMGSQKDDVQLKCRYSVRSNQPTFLYWLHLSTDFNNVPNNCSLQNNVIVIDVGCFDPKQHCITSKDQKADRLYSVDGCFDVTVSTNINGDGFLAFFEKPTFADDDYGHELEVESSFSNYLAYIVICPIIFFVVVIVLLCVLMRRKQHKRLKDNFKTEQKLIYRPTSSCGSQRESLVSPGGNSQIAVNSRISLCDTDPVKRPSSSRLSQRPPSEYRYSKVSRYSRTMSIEEPHQRPSSELRKSMVATCSNVPEEWEGVAYFQQTSGTDSNLSKEEQAEHQTTNFIENPMLETDADADAIVPVLVPLRHHENTKRLSKADRLSSLDSFFDENLLSIEEEDIMEYSRLLRYDSSDSYFDTM